MHVHTCIHETCLDACTNTTVCKHMHLIHMQTLHKGNILQSNVTDRTDTLEYFRRVTAPETAINKSTVPQYILLKINKRAADLLIMCNSCRDIDTLQKIYQHLGLAINEISTSNCSLKRKASNEHSKTQPRYYSTHKRRKITSQTVTKPTAAKVLSSKQTRKQKCVVSA